MSHTDAELNDVRELSVERLEAIAQECLNRWAAYPSIPGSRRWQRNGGLATRELARRAALAPETSSE